MTSTKVYVMFQNLLVLMANSLFKMHLQGIMVVVFIILDRMLNCFDEYKYHYSLQARLIEEMDNLPGSWLLHFFSLVCLSFIAVTLAAAAIYSYAFIIPALLWGLLLWRRSNAGYSFLEILCVYGYSLSIYIPISVSWKCCDSFCNTCMYFHLTSLVQTCVTYPHLPVC